MTAIYDTMRFVTCDIMTVCLGQAASAASVLLAAGDPGKRMALPGARILIHQPSVAEPIQGQAADLEIQANEIQRTRELLEELYAKHTGQPVRRVSEDIERDKVFGVQEAIAYGLIDRVTASRKRPAAPSRG